MFLIRKEELARKNEMLSDPLKIRMMIEQLESKHRSKKEKKSKKDKKSKKSSRVSGESKADLVTDSSSRK